MPQLGLDPERIYKQAGFDPSILEKPGTRIFLEEFMTIWIAVETLNTDPDLGLHIGEKAIMFPGHILFMLMLNAPSIHDAIDKFSRYYNLMTDFSTPCLTKGKRSSSMTIQYNIGSSGDVEISRHSNEGILSAYASVLRRISENKVEFDGVYFTHSRPDDISEHRRIFNAPVYFDQPENRLEFKSQYLELPVLLSDDCLLETLERLAGKLQEKIYAYQPWSHRVSEIILDMIDNQKTEIETIAKKLSTSPRNLQNRLKKEGVTYQKLLDDIRKEQARYLLENENIPISEVAFLLGYSEQSAFGRAFKRWSGMTPNQYRLRFKS